MPGYLFFLTSKYLSNISCSTSLRSSWTSFTEKSAGRTGATNSIRYMLAACLWIAFSVFTECTWAAHLVIATSPVACRDCSWWSAFSAKESSAVSDGTTTTKCAVLGALRFSCLSKGVRLVAVYICIIMLS